MSAPLIARIVGVLFLIAGIAGFVPILAPAAPFDAPVVSIDAAYRLLAGLFPVNAAHDALHIVFGITGILVGRSFRASVLWCRIVGWIYVVLAILGVIPLTNTLFGVAPIYGADTWLHAAIALIALYGGYGRASRQDLMQPEAF